MWDFGDGETSTEENPSHTYSAGGDYTVKLTATGEEGTIPFEVSHQLTLDLLRSPLSK